LFLGVLRELRVEKMTKHRFTMDFDKAISDRRFDYGPSRPARTEQRTFGGHPPQISQRTGDLERE